MKTFFHNLLEYNKTCNSDIIKIIIDNKIENTKINKLISHILNVQDIWISRLEKRIARFNVWELHQNNLLDEINTQLHIESQYFINSLSEMDFEGIIRFMNNKGEGYNTEIKNGLTHLILHSNHHRGQIATILRQLDIEPPSLGYVFFLNNKS